MKGDTLNKGEEFLYKMFLDPAFQNDLEISREFLGIPKGGFDKEEERQQWFESENKKENTEPKAMSEILRIQKKYKIPVSYLFGLNDYLFFNDARNMSWQKFSVATILPPAHTLDSDDVDLEDFYRDNSEPYAKLLIFGNGTKNDVINYIRKYWKEVEEILKKQDWKPQGKVRKTIYKDRNRLIKELWHTPANELRKETGTTTTFKDLLIQQVLKKRGYGEIDDGYIRKLCKKTSTSKRKP